jgi:hypothetical protein
MLRMTGLSETDQCMTYISKELVGFSVPRAFVEATGRYNGVTLGPVRK